MRPGRTRAPSTPPWPVRIRRRPNGIGGFCTAVPQRWRVQRVRDLAKASEEAVTRLDKAIVANPVGRDSGRQAMSIDTVFLRRCIQALELALAEAGKRQEANDFLYDIYRAACVKEFELVLEQSGKLLRKRLAAFFASNRQADRLVFKDLFRHAAKHGLLDPDTVERWLQYRDNRNDTAHNYGEDFAEATLKLLPAFLADAKALADMIEAADDG